MPHDLLCCVVILLYRSMMILHNILLGDDEVLKTTLRICRLLARTKVASEENRLQSVPYCKGC